MIPPTSYAKELDQKPNIDSDDEDYVPESAKKKKRVEKAKNILQHFMEDIEENINDSSMLSALEVMDKTRKKMCNSNALIAAVQMFGKEKEVAEAVCEPINTTTPMVVSLRVRKLRVI